MNAFPLLAPALALALLVQGACAQPQPAPAAAANEKADAPVPSGPHFVDMTATPVVFVRRPGDPEAATIRLDEPAIAGVKPDVDSVLQVKVSYDDADHSTWSAERDLDPRLEAIFASTGAQARLVATSTTAYQRDYWFVTGEDIAPAASALRALPSVPRALIAVIRSNPDTLASLKPTDAELAASKTER
ncbi:MAG TPA: hypothetical protein VFE03_03680 [Caulobacteraceae bacterium]|jgi:hypothetical protein|nr:hypothetical protein [Caulobacteraceae bacterium]